MHLGNYTKLNEGNYVTGLYFTHCYITNIKLKVFAHIQLSEVLLCNKKWFVLKGTSNYTLAFLWCGDSFYKAASCYHLM